MEPSRDPSMGRILFPTAGLGREQPLGSQYLYGLTWENVVAETHGIPESFRSGWPVIPRKDCMLLYECFT